MASRLFIHATNVHQGGGRALLDALLKAIPPEQETVLNLDERMPLPPSLAGNIEIRRYRPTIGQRLRAEKWLADHARETDAVLCFGNLPPLFRLRARTVVFMQNRYLIDDIKLDGFSPGIRLRLVMERLWLSARMVNADEFIVQTPSMQNLAERKMQGRVPVRVLPFVAMAHGYVRGMAGAQADRGKEFDFVYVASGEPHKNHPNLLLAWVELAKRNIFPRLALTLSTERFPELCQWIAQQISLHGLKVTLLGERPADQMPALYAMSRALIYPSRHESFGLPLLEAVSAGLPVLAADEPYVNDVIKPTAVFDPKDPCAIADAVRGFSYIPAKQNIRLLTASEFLRQTLYRDPL